MDENKVESGNIPKDKNIKIWRLETFSGSSARTSDSDKVSDSNIEFIKTG